MSYNPISGFALQVIKDNGQVAADYYLKFYEANSTTPLSMATDASGAVLLAKAKINDQGMPISNPLDNTTVFIPYLNKNYRLVVYTSEADADANNTAAAFVNIAAVELSASAGDITANGGYLEYGGTANTITLTNDSGSPSAYSVGQLFRFRATATNTGAVTINVNGAGARSAVTIDGSALPASYLATDKDTTVTYDGTNFVVYPPVQNDSSDLSGGKVVLTEGFKNRSFVSYNTIAQAKADTGLAIGDRVKTAGYTTAGDGGGAEYIVVAGGTGTDDGGSYHDMANGLQLQLVVDRPVSVKVFGAKGDGVTDDSGKIHACLQATPGAILRGGSSGFVVDVSITIPAGKSITSDYEFIDPRDGQVFNAGAYPNRVLLNSSASFILGESSSLRGLAILRKGMVIPANAAEVANFSGIAVTTGASTNGHYIGHCAILGFNIAAYPDPATNTEQFRCEYLNIDCNNGILVEKSYDIVYIENCHCWPSASIGTPGGVDADLQRPGTAFLFYNGGDWNRWTNCFSYGYARGFRVIDCNSVTALMCGTDYTGTNPAASIGFEVSGNCPETKFIGCQAAAQDIGFYINGASTNWVEMTNCTAWASDSHHIYNNSGILYVNGGRINSGTGSGVTVNNSGPTVLRGLSFLNVTTAVNNLSSSNIVRIDNTCSFNGVTTEVSNPYVASVASADPLQLNSEDTVFNVTGVTSFGTLLKPEAYAGKIVTLKFDGALTVNDGGNMNLAGSFNTTSGDSLTLASIGSSWIEISRSVN